jgi:hypothetical protein
MAQVAEHLPRSPEFKPQYYQKKKRKKERKEERRRNQLTYYKEANSLFKLINNKVINYGIPINDGYLT